MAGRNPLLQLTQLPTIKKQRHLGPLQTLSQKESLKATEAPLFSPLNSHPHHGGSSRDSVQSTHLEEQLGSSRMYSWSKIPPDTMVEDFSTDGLVTVLQPLLALGMTSGGGGLRKGSFLEKEEGLGFLSMLQHALRFPRPCSSAPDCSHPPEVGRAGGQRPMMETQLGFPTDREVTSKTHTNWVVKAGIWLLGHARCTATFSLPPCAHAAVTQVVVTYYHFCRTLTSLSVEATPELAFPDF